LPVLLLLLLLLPLSPTPLLPPTRLLLLRRRHEARYDGRFIQKLIATDRQIQQLHQQRSEAMAAAEAAAIAA
jgi:hypothetical protein